jgi:hypothetical protein
MSERNPHHTDKSAKVSFYLPAEAKKWLQIEAIEKETTMSYVVLRLIRAEQKRRGDDVTNVG